RVGARLVQVGESKLELLEATGPDSPVARYLQKRGSGLHHIALRVDDVAAALALLKARGARLVDEQPRRGAGGTLVAFLHPSAGQGVMIELKQAPRPQPPAPSPQSQVHRHTLGDLELISVCDGFFRLDGGSMFRIVPKPLWQKVARADERNRITLAMRPLIIRGARTMIIDAGLGDKDDQKFRDLYGVDRTRHLD